MNSNNNCSLKEFLLYEELTSFFYLESDEILAWMNLHFEEISREYRILEFSLIEKRKEEMNKYQLNIMLLYNLLKDLWVWRN